MSEAEEDDDNEFPEFSDDSDADEEPSRHDELISKISKLGRKRKLEQREEPSTVVSEFHLSNSKEIHVNTEDLLSALSNKKGVRQLKSRFTKVDNKTEHLLKPLPKAKKEKLQRKVAFEESSAKVSKWESIVKHNRKAEHLKFPLQVDVPPQPSLSTKVESFEPRTPMELEIAAVLKESQHNLQSDQELTEAEKKALLKLSLEEAKEKRAELRKMRSLISAYEQKQRRIGRIKSKKFHKVQKKLKEKRESSRTDPDEDNIQKAERLRAKERATLKHSRMSKWAKDQLVRKHRDQSVRNALTEQSMLKRELKQKNVVEESSSDEGSVVTESEEEDNTPFTSDPTNPWLQQESPLLLLGSKKSRKKSTQNTASITSAEQREDVSDSESGTIATTPVPRSSSESSKSRKADIIDPQKFMKSSDIRKSKLVQASENLLAVQEAFAGDDVVDEFLKDKQQEIEDDKPKKVDTRMPGWGNWAGLGVVEKKKRERKEQETKDEDDDVNERMDSHLKYVIINHKRDKKMAKHMVSELPYPFTDGVQFKKMMAAPLGRHWNTETRYSELIRPRIQTSIGSLIQPMRMTDEVQKFMSKTAKDRKKRISYTKAEIS